MKYVFMIISITISVLNSCLLKKFGEVNKKEYSMFLFNGGVSFVWVMLMSMLFLISGNEVNGLAVAFGMVYGILLFAFLVFKTQSMSNGPVSLSTLIASCAFLITTAFGVIYAQETVNIIQILGMILLLMALVLCVNPKKSKEKLSLKWMLYSGGTFLLGGCVGILYKLFGLSSANEDIEVMILTAAIVSVGLFLIVGLKKEKNIERIKPDKTIFLFILLCGMTSCTYQTLNATLAKIIPSVIFFPVSNGGMVLLSTTIGHFYFKEKLHISQKCGIALGCMGIVLIGCGEMIIKRMM